MQDVAAGPDIVRTLERLRTTDGLFLTDANQHVVYWSASAEKLLGLPASEAVGKSCYEVLVGEDFKGHPFCRDRCPIASNAAKGRPVRDYEVTVAGAQGKRLVINNSVILWPEASGNAVLHLFRPARRTAAPPVHGKRKVPKPHAGTEALSTPLSRREMEVIRVAAQGLRTQDIAATLGVSAFTVRNQLSSVMRKLNARSRLDAILRATEHGLL